ncbi:MAG: sigma-70 family RNA polymerase sigma factor [Bacteroidota bacterium]
MQTHQTSRHREFENAMVPHMDLLYSYAFYLTNDRDQASDLMQDTYLKAYRFFDSFEQGTNAKAWLHRIMRNTYINEYRRLRRMPEIIPYDEQITPSRMTQQGGEFATRLDAGSLDDEMAAALGALPEKYRSVVVLRDIEDLPYEEVAEALEIPIGTVRSRLHRARGLLFERLRGYARSRGFRVGETYGEAVPAEA